MWTLVVIVWFGIVPPDMFKVETLGEENCRERAARITAQLAEARNREPRLGFIISCEEIGHEDSSNDTDAARTSDQQ